MEHIQRLGGDVRLGAVVEEAAQKETIDDVKLAVITLGSSSLVHSADLAALDPLRLLGKPWKQARRLFCAQTALWIT